MRELFLSATFVGSLVSLTYGAWLAWEPAGFIVPGVILQALSIRAAMTPAEVEKDA